MVKRTFRPRLQRAVQNLSGFFNDPVAIKLNDFAFEMTAHT